MTSSFFFALLLYVILSYAEAAFDAVCPPAKCGPNGFTIMYPFRLRTHQPQHCGEPGFELFCSRNNNTMIHFPSYGDLVVKSISYDTRKLNLLDPKNCVHEVFLSLNLSLTPFRYFYVVKNYTYFNCSASVGTSSAAPAQVPCLSGSRHHVYTVESYDRVRDSCRPMKTVAIPFAYSSYLSDNSFGLGLTWELPERDDSDFQSKRSCWLHLAPKYVPMMVGLVILTAATAAAAAVVMLVNMRILGTKIEVSHEDKENQISEELLAQRKIPKASKQ